jgi:2-phosphoglycolate phosphatase
MIGGKQAVLFDLDGTLVDTAPDLVRILDDMITEHGADPLPYETSRSVVSNGSLGLVKLGFPGAEGDTLRALQAEFLERYDGEVCRDSRVFPGLDSLLDALDAAGRRWGIVTNKPERMTRKLLDALALNDRASCVVCGDTLPERKPHPAPLLFASRQTGVEPARTVYVGDALRDIEAGRAAGMSTIAVGYGYIVDGDSTHDWAADFIAGDTDELATLIRKAVNLPD